MKDLEASIFILTKVVAIVRMIPDEVFVNEETKQNMMAAISEALDGFIERETDEEAESVSASADQSYGILGEITAELGLPGTSGPQDNSLLPDILQSAALPPADTRKPASADFIIQKITGQLADDRYSDPVDAFKDVQGLARRPDELKKLLDHLPELRSAGVEAEQFADMAEKYISDLLVSVKPQ